MSATILQFPHRWQDEPDAVETIPCPNCESLAEILDCDDYEREMDLFECSFCRHTFRRHDVDDDLPPEAA